MISDYTPKDTHKEPEIRQHSAEGKENRSRILTTAEELFMRYGFKAITMDEIARHLGISKKTLYQYFEDKDDIVKHCMENHFDCEKDMYKQMLEIAENPVHEFLMEVQQFKLISSTLHPSALFELKKYHPKAWSIFQDHKEKWIIKSIVENLRKGIDEGFYRSEIEPEILARMRIEQIYLAFDPQVFPNGKFELKTILLQFIEHFLHGILTDKGRNILTQLIQKYENNTI